MCRNFIDVGVESYAEKRLLLFNLIVEFDPCHVRFKINSRRVRGDAERILEVSN
jgi:hypothetical protein